MAHMQEPCPLCGRDMTAIETHSGRGELYCDHCDLTIGGNDAKTPEELMALMDGSEHRRLKTENAKLRELVNALSGSLLFSCSECWFHGDVKTCDNNNCGNHKAYQKMRELGIEV